MRVAIYLRVSTLDQASEGFSLDAQRERLIAYCKAQGWDEITEYMDDGETGANLDRPALKRMVRNIEEGKIKAVVVLKLDRLSRKQKDALYLLEEVFDKNGVIFKSATEPFDTSTPLGKAMIGVLAVFAQLERDMIVERTVTGKLQRIKQGRFHGGHAPIGYRWAEEGGYLEIVEDEAEVIREIFTRFNRGESMQKIGKWAAKRLPYTVENTVIRRILTRPTYAGKQFYSGKIFESDTPSIIDVELWESVQKEMGRRKDGLPPRGEYLLTGLCRCGVCGASMVHEKKTGTNRRYPDRKYVKDYIACYNQKMKFTCKLGYNQREKVEQFVIDRIKRIASEPSALMEIAATDEEDYSSVRKALEARIKDADTGLDNLYEAIQSGIVRASSVAKRIKDLENDKEAAEQQLEDLKDRESPRKTVDVSFIQEIGDLWEDLEEEEQKIALRSLILSIKVNPRGQEPEILWNLSP